MTSTKRAHLLTLGCARNETDSDELAARLAQAGWELTAEAASADAVLVNTCGFIDAAKKDSIDALLAAHDLKTDGQVKAVVAVGCMAERYGDELAADLPEADAVLGFDSYPEIGQLLAEAVAGRPIASHRPRDRRLDSARAPIARADAAAPAEAGVLRVRLDSKPYAPLKIAGGCDRRCAFCAIPRFRGAFTSRRPTDIIAEAAWLADRGVRELLLVSENSTSYGKDLGDMRLMEALLPALGVLPGIEWVRLSYLQPAEMRPSLIAAIADTPQAAPYFDLSFQHAAPTVLRRMRRFGGAEHFLDLIGQIRRQLPNAGIRSNVIVGFPGETEAELEELCEFLGAAGLDAVGVFGYSDEADTEAETMTGKLPAVEVARRLEYVTTLVDELVAQRAEDRIGSDALFMVESVGAEVEGRVEWQGPEVDGSTILLNPGPVEPGDFLRVRITGSVGADLRAELR